MSLINCSNKENEDLLLLAKYQYGQINNLTMIPALRFVMAQHLALDPYESTLLTMAAVTNKLTRAVMAFCEDDLLKMHGGSFLPNLMEKFAKDAHSGIHELFHVLTMLQMMDNGVELRPCPKPDEKMRVALEQYLQRIAWLRKLRPGSQVLWADRAIDGEAEEFFLLSIPQGYYAGINDSITKVAIGNNSRHLDVPITELEAVPEPAAVSNS